VTARKVCEIFHVVYPPECGRPIPEFTHRITKSANKLPTSALIRVCNWEILWLLELGIWNLKSHSRLAFFVSKWLRIGFEMALFGFKWVCFLTPKSSFHIGKIRRLLLF